MQMLFEAVMVINLISGVISNSNNAPKFDANIKDWNCTKNDSDICEIKFVVEPFQSMTYYNIIDGNRKLVGYMQRAF